MLQQAGKSVAKWDRTVGDAWRSTYADFLRESQLPLRPADWRVAASYAWAFGLLFVLAVWRHETRREARAAWAGAIRGALALLGWSLAVGAIGVFGGGMAAGFGPGQRVLDVSTALFAVTLVASITAVLLAGTGFTFTPLQRHGKALLALTSRLRMSAVLGTWVLLLFGIALPLVGRAAAGTWQLSGITQETILRTTLDNLVLIATFTSRWEYRAVAVAALPALVTPLLLGFNTLCAPLLVTAVAGSDASPRIGRIGLLLACLCWVQGMLMLGAGARTIHGLVAVLAAQAVVFGVVGALAVRGVWLAIEADQPSEAV